MVFKLLSGLVAFIFIGLSSSSTDKWPDFQSEGYGPRPLEKRIGGLGFQVSLEGWPRLLKEPVPYYSIQSDAPRRPLLDFGTIISNSKEPLPAEPQIFQADWAHVGISVSPALKLYVSRLTPALVVESSAKSLTLFGGEKTVRPAFFATPEGVLKAQELKNVSLSQVGKSWLLIWFGRDGGFQSTRFPYSYDGRGWVQGPASPVDCPLLLIFQNAPSKMEVGNSGLVVEFGDPIKEAGRLALLPLFGDNYPRVSETEAWTDGLPEEVSRQCYWWASHLTEVPLTATETYTYDDKTDTVTLTAKVTFLKLREGGTRFAPLPPMLALAKEQGFPLEPSGEVLPTSVLTAIGPYAGIEGVKQYSLRVGGLGKYVRQARFIGRQPKEPQTLGQMLRDEVSKIIQAGHLAPWYPAVNVFGAGYRTYLFHPGTLTWSNPGETLFFLSETLPLLDKKQRAEVLAYLKKERLRYPPERIAVLRADEGNRRERWRIEEAEKNDILQEHNELVQKWNFYVTNQIIPEENLYYLAEFSRLTGSKEELKNWPELRKILYPFLARQDWATLGWYRWPGSNATFNGWGGVVDANHHFAALIGALRLAYWSGDAEGQALLWGQFARAAILRYSIGHYANYLYDNKFIILDADHNTQRGIINPSRQPDWMVKYFEESWTGRLYTYSWKGPEDDVRTIVRLNELGVQFDEVLTYYAGKGLLPYRGIVPELGRFLSDYEKSKARKFVDRVAENMPDWYLALCTANIGAEFNYLIPEDSYQCFMARAWILGESPQVLKSFLDVPWMERGDLYYLHKLAETIKAYRGVTWRPLF